MRAATDELAECADRSSEGWLLRSEQQAQHDAAMQQHLEWRHKLLDVSRDAGAHEDLTGCALQLLQAMNTRARATLLNAGARSIVRCAGAL